MNNFTQQPQDSQTTLNYIVLEYLREQKRKRFTRWLIRIFIVAFVLLLSLQWFFTERAHNKPHIGIVDLKGTIAEDDEGDASLFVRGLDSAYKSKGLEALIIRINSPGGSPVQADYMYNSLRHFKSKYPKVKIYAVCTDLCASAAYYVAAAADEIYANEASLIGSIGVVYSGFGFVDGLQKLGVTRRLQTAGTNKGFLDPFLPESPQQKIALQNMLNEIHQQFIAKVKAGRGARLKIDADIFSGLLWTGVDAKKRGLIDGFASAGELAREILHQDKIIEYTHQSTPYNKMFKQFGASIAKQLPAAFIAQSGVKA